MRPPSLHAVLLFAALLAAAGCGGGSGSGGASVAAQKTGRLVAPVVAGLAYATPTRSGVTGSDGSFRYLPGESITFTLGATTLGATVPAANELDAFTLVPGATPPLTARAIERFLAEQVVRPPAADVLLQCQAVNLLVLLLTLDADRDPSNGVALAPSLDAVLATTAIDLRMPVRTFASSARFREARYAAFQAGRVTHAGAASPWLALDVHCAARKLVPQAYRPLRLDRDSDGDGTPDTRTESTLDARGWRIADAIDFGVDGTFDRIDAYQLDDGGQVASLGIDFDGDGALDYRDERTYDLHGNLTLMGVDTDGDGVVERVSAYEYGATGLQWWTGTDADGDGRFDDTTTEYEHDADGRLIRQSSDWDGDGAVDQVIATSYDAGGNAIEQRYDDDGDGDIERTTWSTFDAAGNALVIEWDDDGDRAPDRRSFFAYDAAGNLVRSQADYDLDGSFDAVESHSFDERRRVVRREADFDGDGVLDDVDAFQYFDAASGLEYERREDWNADGSIDYRVVRTFGQEGELLAIDYDVKGDGVVDARDSYLQQRVSLFAAQIGR